MNEFNSTTPSTLNSDDRLVAILAHLAGPVAIWLGGFGFLGPLIFYFLTKDRSPELRAHVLEALNFSLTNSLAAVALSASMLLVITIPFALVGLGIVWIGYFIYAVIGAVDVTKGRLRRYPFTWRVITD